MSERELIKRKETDLEIADFLWEILRRWRLVLILASLSAILLSGWQLAKDVKAAKATPQQVQEEQELTLEEMENALGAQDMDEVLGAVAMKKQLDEKSAYAKESELMQINPYEENVVFLQYYVMGSATDVDYAALFLQHIKSGAYDSELVDVLIGEEISYATSNGGYISSGANTLDCNNSFVVRVRGNSQSQCSELATMVKSDLDQYAIKSAAVVDGLSLSLMNENACVIIDEELASYQNQISMMIKQLNNNLDSLKSNMTGNQLALYSKYTKIAEQAAKGENMEMSEEQNEVQIEEATQSVVSVRFSFGKFVIGAVVGIFLAIVWILLAFLLTVKLRSENEVQSLYHVNVLGNIRLGKENPIDRMILKARYHKAGALTLEEEINLICANIKVACQKENSVYLSGSVIDAMPKEIVEQIVEECSEKGITVVAGKELSYHADALEKLAEVGQVVFMEQLRDSYYDEVYKEVKTCIEHKFPVLGMIIVGA